jgi:hypothetical protein
MKKDSSVKNISIAAIKRSAMNLDKWTRTTICLDSFPMNVDNLPNELPVVYFSVDNMNWTLITTKRIVGEIDSMKREVYFNEMDDIVWGEYKSDKKSETIFRIVNFEGEQNDFLMETGKPAMGIISSVRTIERMTKASH